MRKIIPQTRPHNGAAAAARVLCLAATLALLALLPACGGGDSGGETTAAGEAAAPAGDAAGCGVVLDASGWEAFRDLGERIVAHAPVSREDLAAYGDLPAVAGWRATQSDPQPPALRVANWIEATFWDELGKSGDQKRNRDRSSMSSYYRYDFDHRDAIDARLTEFAAENLPCATSELVRRWVRPDSIPAPLRIRILPTLPELRIDEGCVYADAGLFFAAGSDQFMRHVASLLYRKYEAPVGPPPHEQAGEEAVLQSVRALAVEGVANWIEDVGTLHFADDHPSLKRIHIVPEDLFTKAQRVIELFNSDLPEAFADTASMHFDGPALANTLVARNAFIGTGYAMASVIAARLGEDRLVAVRRSVPDFLAAYQEAALQNTLPVPVPGTRGVELYECVPPLDPAVFSELHARLAARFAAQD